MKPQIVFRIEPNSSIYELSKLICLQEPKSLDLPHYLHHYLLEGVHLEELIWPLQRAAHSPTGNLTFKLSAVGTILEPWV